MKLEAPKTRGRCTIRVNGGSQRHEVEGAAKAVSGLKGVTRVEPNYLSRQLFVEYDPDHVTMEEIRRAVKSHPGRKTGLPQHVNRRR